MANEIIPFFVLIPGTGYILGWLIDQYIAMCKRLRDRPSMEQLIVQMSLDQRTEFAKSVLGMAWHISHDVPLRREG